MAIVLIGGLRELLEGFRPQYRPSEPVIRGAL
jgi:hypothetical protein